VTQTAERPALHALTHRLSECPADFLAEPMIGSHGVVDVAAVVSDLLRALGGTLLTAEELSRFRGTSDMMAKRLRITLIASWLLYDPWFRTQQRFAAPSMRLLSESFGELAALVDPPAFVSDPDRREELVRLCLRALGLLPEGESEAQAADRLNTLSSVERTRVVQETRAAQERVRQVREAMRKKAAEEAAAAYGRE
jgi:hypothetical protein